MTSTVPPRPPLADEAALRHSFETEYSTLLATARRQLGDAPVLASRVVETAFAHAWMQRDALHSTEELHTLLVDEVQRGAARALSRRAAAHRFGDLAHGENHHGHAPAHEVHESTPEEAWSRIVHTIHVEGHSGEAHAASAEAVRHEAAEHVASIAKGGKWKVPVAIGLLALAITAALFYWLDTKGRGEALSRAVNAQDAREVSAGNGQLAVVTLDDSTRVRVAADSRIKIPQEFSEDLRGVKVIGAAAFDVAPGKATEFQAFAGPAVVTAKGTAFDVHAYPDEPLTVHVREGAVSVRVGERVQELAAGQGVVVGDDGAMHTASPTELEEATAWMDGKLVIANRQLRHALPQFKRWYNLDIKVPDLKLLDRQVTVRTTTEATKEAIAQAEQSGHLQFGYVGQTMTFQDAPAAPAPAPPRKKARR